MSSTLDSYDELCAYTLAHARDDASFLHQHVVDAHTAQMADERTTPIALTFALVGLALHVERQVSGRDVQRIHMRLARASKQWPTFARPGRRGVMTAADVMAVPPGPDRERAIGAWCASVWAAYCDSHHTVRELLMQHRIG